MTAAGASGSVSTSGWPLSPPSRSRTSIGTAPSSGTVAPRERLSPVGHLLAAAGAEHLDALVAVRAGQPRHVLDDAGDALVGLQGDGAGALGDLGGRLLRSGDDEQLGVRHQLGDGDGDVTGAGGQVHEQDVEVAPPDVGQELLQGAVQHRDRARPPACCRR